MFLSIKGSKVGTNEQEKILQSLKRKINPIQIPADETESAITWILDDQPLALPQSSAGGSLEAGPSLSLK